MEFIDENIQQYAEQHTSPESALLHELNRFTHTSVLKPRMLSGHLQGRFLSFISHLLQPTYILDIGTYTGYSALCLAEGLTSNGKLYTIDNNEEVMLTAKSFIDRSVYAQKIETILGDAIPTIKQLNTQVPHWDRNYNQAAS
jgi:caffeoyl-CoA O-methyltransferase